MGSFTISLPAWIQSRSVVSPQRTLEVINHSGTGDVSGWRRDISAASAPSSWEFTTWELHYEHGKSHSIATLSTASEDRALSARRSAGRQVFINNSISASRVYKRRGCTTGQLISWVTCSNNAPALQPQCCLTPKSQTCQPFPITYRFDYCSWPIYYRAMHFSAFARS